MYRPGEVKGLGAVAKQHGLSIHMDGARFFNALTGLNCAPADITWRAGVDVLCCGGTKLGMAVTAAVVFFNKELSQEFAYRCKQAGQLCSKMRFISAQWLRILSDETWRRHAPVSYTHLCAGHPCRGAGSRELLQEIAADEVFGEMGVDVVHDGTQTL